MTVPAANYSILLYITFYLHFVGRGRDSSFNLFCQWLSQYILHVRAGRYEVDGYVYSAEEEPKIMISGKWNTSMSCQPCDQEGEPLPGTELKEVIVSFTLHFYRAYFCYICAMPVSYLQISLLIH